MLHFLFAGHTFAHFGSVVAHPVLDCPAMTLQSSRSLDALSDLKVQRLEAELEGARHEARGACQREEELKAQCERLREDVRQLHGSKRDRVSGSKLFSSLFVCPQGGDKAPFID